ncbi:MAG: hypothetical protein JST67_04135 [Bacteroidetes bacterium]|nr:hypothetical protein [Bacteroidota bacterium]
MIQQKPYFTTNKKTNLHIIKKGSCFLFLFIFFVSCQKPIPPAPGPPAISFVSFTTSDSYNAQLTFSFSDPDGDIGNQVTDQDTSNYDFFMRYYYKNHNGNYVPYYAHNPQLPPDPLRDSTIYPYHLPYITNTITTRALNGQIIVTLSGYKPGNLDSLDNFRYTFWIYDRARLKSNVVTTPSFHTPY